MNPTELKLKYIRLYNLEIKSTYTPECYTISINQVMFEISNWRFFSGIIKPQTEQMQLPGMPGII